ncbi:hypothetical protein [Tepidimicrobium xylanilyticum]|uniref:Uncharacterized protein n=1 Tax=Tepidimicrobium xylanilyticum TaxID=1123352 RepID=A0A1H2TYY1_9FIRM|nr:hypothetical protein [Tepidimicrobium xylanilyticum]GMG98060.1 hypothetical protein EN5CB1_28860 [Tepidimicrobium xylanilyticum]SDW49136.1 hypothetical protein SAMN05660923_00847 [Tepidimicrobium xylanilyticum]
MAYYKDRLSLILDSYENIDLFRLSKGNIIRYHFDRKIKGSKEEHIIKEVFEEYDVTIDEQDTLYIVHQDRDFHLILTLIEKNKRPESIKLTKDPILGIHYLNLFLIENMPHIIYAIPIPKGEKRYRIYHNYFHNGEWLTSIIDRIESKELLKPVEIFNHSNKIFLAYYDKMEEEEIYIREWDKKGNKWQGKIKLTDNKEDKLFLDLVVIESKIHLTYCQYQEGNLVVKYERFNYQYGLAIREVEKILSNPENPQDPILIYYHGKLWVIWVEQDRVHSRYSEDLGNNWSPIYLWNDSIGKTIVRYKYFKLNEADKILNYSFGKIEPEIEFIGFGTLENITEVPLKKKGYPVFKINPKI